MAEWVFLPPSMSVARNSLYHAASNGAALRLFQFHGFFEARVRLFPRPRERRQIISHISRARLTTIFFRPPSPSCPFFSFLHLDGSAALDNNSCITRQNFRCRRSFCAEDREHAFVPPFPIRSQAYPTRRRKKILEAKCVGTIVLS